MKRILYLFVIFLINSHTFSQSGKTIPSYLVLYSGKVINCSYVQYVTPFLNTDQGKFSEDSVRFYQNSSGFYSNVLHVRRGNPTFFIKAITFGKVNMFAGDQYQKAVQRSNWDFSATGKVLYNKGIDKLKIAKYKNLKIDLGDNAKSVKWLHKYRNLRTLQFSICALSVASLVTGIILTSKDKAEYETPSYVALGLTVPLSLVGMYGFNKSKKKRLQKAITAYGISSY
ncbi:MAG: hypothetical protein ACKVQB_09820 [Bacteroidia bacterium]